jgi:hypothetical protein
MTRRTQWNLVAGVLLALGLGAVLVPLLMALTLGPLRERGRLEYPDRVTFTRTPADFSRADWDAADWDDPGPCPLAVRLAGADLAPADLGSPDRMRRLGWTERVYENPDGQLTGTAMTSPGGVVQCSYRAGRLTNVTVDAAKAAQPGGVAVRIGTQWVGLPNTAEGITTTLGPPPSKE